jgi:triosephosphate isomerase
MAAQSKLIIANWKMNLTTHEASLYLHKLASTMGVHKGLEVVLAPSMVALQSLSLQADRKQFKLAAQNFYWRDNGPYTGEVSAAQLHGIVDYSLVGHSERRHVFGETDKEIRSKVQAAIRNGIKPILCIGETADQRTNGETHAVLHDQLVSGLANVTSEELKDVVIAYEPVWAISNGKDFGEHKAPTQEDVQDVEKVIRRQIKHLYGEAAAEKVRVLYGASVNPDNVGFYMGVKGIDGLLVGGASLDARLFKEIVEAAYKSSVVKK